jgi:hypothetical protein
MDCCKVNEECKPVSNAWSWNTATCTPVITTLSWPTSPRRHGISNTGPVSPQDRKYTTYGIREFWSLTACTTLANGCHNWSCGKRDMEKLKRWCKKIQTIPTETFGVTLDDQMERFATNVFSPCTPKSKQKSTSSTMRSRKQKLDCYVLELQVQLSGRLRMSWAAATWIIQLILRHPLKLLKRTPFSP